MSHLSKCPSDFFLKPLSAQKGLLAFSSPTHLKRCRWPGVWLSDRSHSILPLYLLSLLLRPVPHRSSNAFNILLLLTSNDCKFKKQLLIQTSKFKFRNCWKNLIISQMMHNCFYFHKENCILCTKRPKASWENETVWIQDQLIPPKTLNVCQIVFLFLFCHILCSRRTPTGQKRLQICGEWLLFFPKFSINYSLKWIWRMALVISVKIFNKTK